MMIAFLLVAVALSTCPDTDENLIQGPLGMALYAAHQYRYCSQVQDADMCNGILQLWKGAGDRPCTEACCPTPVAAPAPVHVCFETWDTEGCGEQGTGTALNHLVGSCDSKDVGGTTYYYNAFAKLDKCTSSDCTPSSCECTMANHNGDSPALHDAGECYHNACWDKYFVKWGVCDGDRRKL